MSDQNPNVETAPSNIEPQQPVGEPKQGPKNEPTSILAPEPTSEPEPQPAGEPANPVSPEPNVDPEPKVEPEPEPVKPVEYAEFNLPEGFVKDPAMQDAVIPLFQKHKLSQENAQEMIDVFNEVQKVKTAEAQTTFETQVETWTNEKKADPDFEKKMVLAQKGIARLIKEVPSAEKIFGDKLWGNMPEFYEIAQFFGRHMESEATALGGTTGVNGEPKTIAQAFYGDSMKQK